MPDTAVVMSEDEKKLLVEILEHTHKELEIEEHRTRAPRFREHIIDREHLIAAIIAKLQ